MDATAGQNRIAHWGLLVAGGGAALAVLGIAAVQIGLLRPMGAFGAFAIGALLCAPIGLLLGVIGGFRARGGRAGLRESLGTIFVGGVLIATVFFASAPGRGLPPINDITTDLDSPPAFAPATAVPAYAGRDMSYPDGFAELVREAYPDLAPIRSPLPPDRTFDAALAAAEAVGWEVAHEDRTARRFDATTTSRVFRFVDDVTVRIQPEGGGTRVDVRSKSRDGRGDLGANAAHIRAFAEALRSRL